MNIAVCADRFVGYELLKFIFEEDKSPIKLVLTQKDSPYRSKIEKLCSDYGIEYHSNIDCNSNSFRSLLRQKDIDIGLLLWWPKILKKETIRSVKKGFINTHPSLLPLNRGKHPYYWAVINENPLGSTLHFINENIDEGLILFQEAYDIDISQTGDIIYENSLDHMIYLFKKNYKNILTSSYVPKKQNLKEGDFHLSRDIEKHSRIDLEQTYLAKDLLNRIRARTFKNNKSSFFFHNGKRYFVRLEIEEDKGQYD